MNTSGVKKSDRVLEQCLKILNSKTNQGTQKWITDNKLKSMALRNVKAVQTINLANYLLEKMVISKPEGQTVSIQKRNVEKCFQFAHLVRYFSEWDYEFEFIYGLSLDENLREVQLYLRVREVLRNEWNKAKKDMLSGITKQLQEWAGVAKIVFREREEEDVIDLYTTVVKGHYMQVKKSQSEKINGAEFLKICQIMSKSKGFGESPRRGKSAGGAEEKGRMFQEGMLSGLTTQDKELIRVLSYKDKNVAHMLQEKHTRVRFV